MLMSYFKLQHHVNADWGDKDGGPFDWIENVFWKMYAKEQNVYTRMNTK